MTSTLQRTSLEGRLDGTGASHPPDMNGSAVYTEDGSTSVGSDSLVGDINLTIVLPDGTMQTIVVDAAKQMMDLLVQVTASNKLSPPKHMLQVYHEETGQQIEFKASKPIGSLGVSTVYLVRKEDKEQKKNHAKQTVKDGTLPFVKTQRLTANLPKGQKHLLRVDPKCTLGQIYHRICEEKGLDPYKYELRHPTIRDEPLNMSRPLHEYGLSEITVVSATTPDSPPPGEFRTLPAHYQSNLRPASSVTSINSTASEASAMSKRKDNEGYVPGSGVREKKKKGLFSFFSRKKQSGSFSPASTISEGPSTSRAPVDPSVSRQSVAVQHAMPPAQPQHTQTLPKQQTSQTLQSNHGAPPPPQVVQVQSQSLPRSSSRLAAPSGTNRKKRQAPPPPGLPAAKPVEKPVTEPVTVSVTESDIAVNGSRELHSRQSSRSSGFEDTPGSPVESPGTSAEGTQQNAPLKTRVEATSISNTEVVAEANISKTVSETSPRMRELTDYHDHMSDVSSAADSAQGSLPRPSKPSRGKKKMAPAPPPGAGASPEVISTSKENLSNKSPAVAEAEPDIVTADTDIPVANGNIVEATNQVVVDSITTTHSIEPVEGTTAAEHVNDSEDDEAKIEMSTFVEQMKELTDKANTDINLNTSHRAQRDTDDVRYVQKSTVDSNRNIDSLCLVEKVRRPGDTVVNNMTFETSVGSPDNAELHISDGEPAVPDMDNSVILIKNEKKSNMEAVSSPISVSTQHGLHKQSYVPLESPVDSGHSSGDIIGDDEIMFDMDEIVYEEPAHIASLKSPNSSTETSNYAEKPLYVKTTSQPADIEPIVMETIYEQETAAEPDMAGSSDSGDPDSEDVVIETETVVVHPDGTVTVTKVTETKPPGTPLLQEEEHFLQQLPDIVDNPVREATPPPMIPEKEKSPPVTSLRAAYRNGRPKSKPNQIQTNFNYDFDDEPIPIPIYHVKSGESNLSTDEEVPTEVDSDSPEIHRRKFEASQPQKSQDEVQFLHVDPRIKPEVRKPGVSILKKKTTDMSTQPEIEIIETTGSVYKPEDTNVIIYDRTAPNQEENSTFNNYMKSAPRKHRDMELYSPRGWGQGRNKSEPSVKDVKAALVAAEIKQKEIMGHNIKDDDQIVYAGDGSLRSQTSPLQPKVTDINFTPTTEYEKENVMEEKSISQIAFPVERQSEAQVTSSNHGVIVSDGLSTSEQDFHNAGTFTLNFASKQPGVSQEVIQSRTREQSAQALQEQYSQLQEQFARWQDQLQENQVLLSQKKIVPPQDVMVSPTGLPPQENPPPVPLDSYVEYSEKSVGQTRESDVEHKPVSILKTSSTGHNDNTDKPGLKQQQRVQRRQREAGPTTFVMRSSYVPRSVRDSQLMGRLSPSEISPVTVISSSTDLKEDSVKHRPVSHHVEQTQPVETSYRKEPLKSEPIRAKSEPPRTESLRTEPIYRAKSETPRSQSPRPYSSYSPLQSTNSQLDRAKSEPRRTDSHSTEPVLRAKSEQPRSQSPRSFSGSSHVKSLKGNFEVSSSHHDRTRPVSHHEMHQRTVFSSNEEPVMHSSLSNSNRSRSVASVHGSISMPSYRQDVPPNPPPTPTREEPVRAKSEPPITKPKPRTPDHLKNDPRFMPKLDPREELMIAIRNAGGKEVLRQNSS